MQTDTGIFLRCLAASALFALALLALVYFSIPPLQHAVPAEAPWPTTATWSRGDVVRALLGSPADTLRAAIGLGLICIFGAIAPFRRLRAKRRELLLAHAHLARAFAARTETAQEYGNHSAALDAVRPLAAELAERLAALEQRAARGVVLDRAEYEIAAAPAGTARQLRDAFETLAGMLERLEARASELAPQASQDRQALASLEEARAQLSAMEDVGARLKRLGLNIALAGSRAGQNENFTPLAAEAKALAGESVAASAPLASAMETLTQSLQSNEELAQPLVELARQIAQACDFAGEQWPLLEALGRSEGEESLALDIAASARRARALLMRIEQLGAVPNKEAA